MIKRKISIIGLGLIGGSIGLALKNIGRFFVTGFDTDPKTQNLALKMGAIDHKSDNLKDCVQDSEVVFVATPISETLNTLKKIEPFLKSVAIVSDVASVKTKIVQSCPPNITFIGGHPMAGKETTGIGGAQKDLFVNKKWILTSRNRALEQIISLLGAKSTIMNAKSHDQSVATISHLPFIVSNVLFSSASNNKKCLDIAAGGFRDVTRLASGNPTLHTDIVMANKVNILKQLDLFVLELNRIRNLIEQRDKNIIKKFFTYNKIKRDKWLEGAKL